MLNPVHAACIEDLIVSTALPIMQKKLTLLTLKGLEGPGVDGRLPELYRSLSSLTALEEVNIRQEKVAVSPDVSCLTALSRVTRLELNVKRATPELLNALVGLSSVAELMLASSQAVPFEVRTHSWGISIFTTQYTVWM
jgi:hypothetical protein